MRTFTFSETSRNAACWVLLRGKLSSHESSVVCTPRAYYYDSMMHLIASSHSPTRNQSHCRLKDCGSDANNDYQPLDLLDARNWLHFTTSMDTWMIPNGTSNELNS